LKGADHLPGSFNPGIPLVVIRNNAWKKKLFRKPFFFLHL
jgi:hypothetical protein